MSYRLTITARFLAELRGRLRARPGSVVEAFAGTHVRRDGTLEFLVPLAERHAARSSAIVRFGELPRALEGVSHHWWAGVVTAEAVRPRVDVALYQDRGASAAVLQRGRAEPLDEIVIAGPRMERWQPAAAPDDLTGGVPAAGPFSRYVGALGGAQHHRRLCACTAAGVGMARLNSLLAVGLARAGVRELVLIDPDVLEDHSLDAVEVLGLDALGRPKVEGVARMLRAVAPHTVVHPLPVPAEHPDAVAAAADTELIFSAPDRNQARLVASLLATAHHRIHLDVGTGVFGAGETFVAGADVRLVVPGEGCLLCLGGLDLARRHETDWRRARAGSLRSLNGLATSLALFLFERFVVGDLTESTWLQVTLDRRGEPQVRRMPREEDPECPGCAQAGAADALVSSQPAA